MDIAELDAALGDAHRAFVDTSSCIAYLSTIEPSYPLARHLFGRIADDADPLMAYISMVTVSEMLVRPIRAGDYRLGLVTSFLRGYPNLQVIDVDFAVAQTAATVRATTRLALPDAMIVSTALLSGCEVIVTNDARWSRRLAPLFPQFAWIYLGR